MTDLVILTDEPAPYREPVFQELARRLDLLVIYVSETSLRGWDWWRYARGHECRFASIPRPVTAIQWARAANRLRGLLDEARPRAIVVGGWNLPTSWAALLYGRAHRTPVALWVESTLLDARKPHSPRELAKRVLQSMATSAIVPGTRSAEYVRSFGATTVDVAPNAVNNADFAPRRPETPRSTAKTVTYVGRLAPEKGLDTLVAALVALAPRCDVEVIVVGDGPQRNQVHAALEQAGVGVCFTGLLMEPSAIAEVLWRSDVLVLPSTSDVWGLVVNEAMAAEVPVVVSNVVGCGPDLVTPGLTGEVFTSGDPADLARALERVLVRGRPAEVRGACRAAAERHSPARCAEGFVRFFERETGGSSR